MRKMKFLGNLLLIAMLVSMGNLVACGNTETETTVDTDSIATETQTDTMASVLTAFKRLFRTLAFFIQRVGLGRS